MEPIKQTGFLYKEKPTDFIAGANSPLVNPDVMPSSDWRGFLPNGEKQYKYATFDTMSCVTFSALNIIETWAKYYKSVNAFSPEQIAIMNTLGFFADGEFNGSDRFTAIISKTTQQGNYFQNVWDSIRNDGLLPEAILPFGGNSWNEYHDPAIITEDMKSTAKKILDIFEFSYEFVPSITPSITPEFLVPHLKQAPLQVAIPIEATHAVELVYKSQYFDSYEPYVKDIPTIKYVLKPIVKVKKYVAPIPVPAYQYFAMDEKTDSSGKHTFSELDPGFRSLVDKMRGECGFAWKITSGYRTQAENDATPNSVSDSAHVSRIAIDVYCTDSAKRDKIVNVAKANGITRIGIGATFVHLDIDTTKPQHVMWHYY